MSKQKVSTVDGRDVKFFPTRKKARRFNSIEGTKGVYDIWEYYLFDIKKEDQFYRWFVFLDTKPENVAKQGKGAIIPNVAGQPVKFFPARHEARQYYWTNKGSLQNILIYINFMYRMKVM